MQPPILSLAERDRRWTRVRHLMRERGLDGLLVAGFRSREMYETYISDDYNEGCVLFPLEGEPVVITWAHLRVMRARWSQERGATLWVDDYRVATSGAGVAEVLSQKGLAASSLGVVGLCSQAPTEIYGAIPANFWMELTAALPKARWEDISEEFSHLMLVKSDEEMAQVRYAARAAEAACRVIVEVAAPGVGEEVVFAEATREMLRHGIGLRYPMIVMNSGPQTLSWGPPRWTTTAEAPRILARGDLMQAELMPLCGNQEVQVQMTVALDPLDETNLKCERVARASYEAGIKALKPGISFADLVAVMEEPLKSAGCWGYTPLVHSLGPHFLAGRTAVNQEQAKLDVRFVGPNGVRARQAVLEPGMVFAFEPNACIGRHRVNIGGTVIVTASGCEELNHIPTSVAHKQ
ncbi:MAG TPA: M24 family metallopeptidase [Xanthobacteraceae bacterium]|jgi:Xaa-Pro aminopeptidase|nr:M24 family metallopeptidase [Xanthobacteraceae bacterium]